MAVMQYMARQRDIIRTRHGRVVGAAGLCAPCGRVGGGEARGAYAHMQARGRGQSAGALSFDSERRQSAGVLSLDSGRGGYSRGILAYEPVAEGFAAAVLSRARANCRPSPNVSGHSRICRSGAVYAAAHDGRVEELLAEFGDMKGLNKRERAAYLSKERAEGVR